MKNRNRSGKKQISEIERILKTSLVDDLKGLDILHVKDLKGKTLLMEAAERSIPSYSGT